MSAKNSCLCALLLVALPPGVVWSQASLSMLETISAEGTAEPVIETFDIPSPGDYEIIITDFGIGGTPVPPAQGVYLLVTSTDTNEVIANIVGPGQSTASFGDSEHRMTLVVVPDTIQPRSSIGVSIESTGLGTGVLDRVDVFDISQATENPSALEYDFEAARAGRHEFSVRDTGFPDVFETIDAILLNAGTGTPLAIVSGTGSVELDLNAGDRVRIAVVATRASDTDRSLLVVDVAEAGESVAAFATRVGDWGAVLERPINVAAGGSVTTTVTDFSLPQQVAGLTTVILQGDLPAIGPISGSGSASASLAAGPALLLAAADATATGTAGLSVTGLGGATLLDEVVAFDGADGATGRFASINAAFSVVAADTLTFVVSDFRFPTAFSSVAAVIAQNGAEVASLERAGTLTVDLQPGDYSLAVVGELPAGSSGLLAVGLTGSDGTTLVEEFAAGGSAVRSVPVSIAAGDLLRLDLADLQFPAAFETLNAVLTRGTDLIANVFGGGSTSFDASAGEYLVHFVARPDNNIGHSTFSVQIGEQPRAPTVALTSDRTSVPTGGGVGLSWDSDFANDCVASGGWSGAKGTTGTQQIDGISAETQFHLTCNGPGGSADATVVVTVTTNGGGGAFYDPRTLAILAFLWLLRSRRRGTPS